MFSQIRTIWSSLFLLFLITQFTTAAHLSRRQDSSNTITSDISQAFSTTVEDQSASETLLVSASDQTNTASGTETEISDAAAMDSATATNAASSSDAKMIPTATYTGSLVFSPTATPANGLPIEIRLTPSFGVAAILLMATGGTLALWKNTFSQTFLSNGLLASLATTVLIIYIMDTPVSDGVQGGYLIAVVLTGAILGGAATFFREITESLGCLLGGFCMSMWLLTLRSDGLIHNSVDTIIFIALFCAVGWATYYSCFTRDWALMIFMSFSGVTTLVLGIDCFSRAGLKEFWVYLWNVNGDIFIKGIPFKLTKGIRIESAVIIIFFVTSLVIQTRIWYKIKVCKAVKAADEKAARADIEAQDEASGRAIQAKIVAERAEWEQQYGEVTEFQDSDDTAMIRQSSQDSGVHCVMHDNRKIWQSVAVTAAGSDDGFAVSHTAPGDNSVVQEPQGVMHRAMSTSTRRSVLTVNRSLIAPVSPSYPPDSPLIPPHTPERQSLLQRSPITPGLAVIVRVSRDDTPLNPRKIQQMDAEEREWIAAREIPQVTDVPEVVPLPFRVEEGNEETKPIGSCSSIATFNDGNDDDVPLAQSRRISQVSMRRISQSGRSLILAISDKSTRQLTKEEQKMLQETEGPTLRDIIEARRDAERNEEDEISVAATFDGADSRLSWAVTSKLGLEQEDEKEKKEDETATVKDGETEKNKKQAEGENEGKIVEDGEGSQMTGSETEAKSEDKIEDSNEAKPHENNENKEATEPNDTNDSEAQEQDSEKTSISPSSTSNPLVLNTLAVPFSSKSTLSRSSSSVSITKDLLPDAFSRTALKYRINEWVKHSTTAEPIAPEDIAIEPLETEIACEPSAPVDVADLSLTAADVTIPTARIERSNSLSPSSMWIPAIVTPSGNRSRISRSLRSGRLYRSVSFNGGVSGRPSMTLENFQRPAPPAGIQSHDVPQTLLGQRDLYLKAKSQIMQLPRSVTDSNFRVMGNEPNDTADDIPLSQRKQLIRQRAIMTNTSITAPVSPRRNVMDLAQRESRLASFRESVQADIANLATSASTSNLLSNSKQTSILNSRAPPQVVIPNALKLSSSLVPVAPKYGREDEEFLQRQRSLLMGKKEAERMAWENSVRERELKERRQFERMGSSIDLQEAHREALRKMRM